MKDQLIFVGATFAFLSLLPFIWSLNIFGILFLALIMSPFLVLFPGMLKAGLNFLLHKQCLPASFGSAQIDFQWKQGLEITMIANDFQISNPVHFLNLMCR